MTKQIQNWIDPPNGWLYGFPKQLPDDVTNVNSWLIENGYPKNIIDELGEFFHYRILTKEVYLDGDKEIFDPYGNCGIIND